MSKSDTDEALNTRIAAPVKPPRQANGLREMWHLNAADVDPNKRAVVDLTVIPTTSGWEGADYPDPKNARVGLHSFACWGIKHAVARITSPMKVLIVAEHASTVFGGEALIPYQYFKCLRELGVNVHLLVHERTKSELLNAFQEDAGRLHFVADSLTNIWCYKFAKRLPDRLALFTLGAVSHLETQIRQRRLARRLIREQRFDLVHEPIPVSPKQPSLMFGLKVPVIIGPLNGGMDYPPNYDAAGHFERIVISALRWSADFWNRIFAGKRHAALLLIANQRTRAALPRCIKHRKIIEFVENGVDVNRFCNNPARKRSDRLEIVYLGRLVDWKRVDLLLKAAAALVGKLSFRVTIVGDGPERAKLEADVRRLALSEYVKFCGWVLQSMAAEILAGSDVMVLPSVRECGGAVVLEGMASGLPVIATEWGGPTDYVTGETGILIAPGTPKSFVKGLADAIVWMAKNPEMRIKMGDAARQRALSLYDWGKKAETMIEIYKSVLDSDISVHVAKSE